MGEESRVELAAIGMSINEESGKKWAGNGRGIERGIAGSSGKEN